MSIRKAIYDLLNDTEADVYAMVGPQELTDPYVVYNIRINPERTQDGVGPTEAILTLNVYANTDTEAITLADSMYAGMENASGTYDNETLMVCNWTSEDGDYLEGLEKYLIIQEYQLRFI